MLRESEWGGKRHAAMPGEGLAIRSVFNGLPERKFFQRPKSKPAL